MKLNVFNKPLLKQKQWLDFFRKNLITVGAFLVKPQDTQAHTHSFANIHMQNTQELT